MHRKSHSRTTELELRARLLRSRPTPSEAALWEAVRGGKLGVWFKRQVVLGDYIVDFVAPRVRLVVEVDGGYHSRRGAGDARRERVLRRMGYRVVRVDAEVVLGELHRAVAQLRRGIGGA